MFEEKKKKKGIVEEHVVAYENSGEMTHQSAKFRTTGSENSWSSLAYAHVENAPLKTFFNRKWMALTHNHIKLSIIRSQQFWKG